MILLESKVMWLAGLGVGAIVAPKNHRIAGAILGALVIGSIGDAVIDRVRTPRVVLLPVKEP